MFGSSLIGTQEQIAYLTHPAPIYAPFPFYSPLKYRISMSPIPSIPAHDSHEESQIQRTHSRQTHHRPPTPDYRLILELPSSIPHQMSDSIPAMVRKRQGNSKLRRCLQR